MSEQLLLSPPEAEDNREHDIVKAEVMAHEYEDYEDTASSLEQSGENADLVRSLGKISAERAGALHELQEINKSKDRLDKAA